MAFPRWLEQALGVLLVLMVLLDAFLTVLYARIGAGIFTRRLSRGVWRLFCWAAAPFKHRGAILSFCGPLLIVIYVAVWSVLLTCGLALIIQPELGRSIVATSGPTNTDFLTAMFAGGSSIAIVSAGTFAPLTSSTRLFYLFTSFIGVAGITLTVTYLLQVYAALQRRNTLGAHLYLAAGQSGDAAELVAGLGPCGRFSAGYSNLTGLAEEMTAVEESHHFYPVLFYFRFRQPEYSVSRFTLVSLDAVALMRSALPDDQQAWLKQSASATQLERASTVLVTTLESTFLPGGTPDPKKPPDPDAAARWRRRYVAALDCFRAAHIPTVADEAAGADAYVALRARWDRYVTALAPYLGYSMQEVDPAGSAAAQSNR